MNVMIRVDASPDLGLGHLMRCLSLALALKARNVEVGFLCRSLPGFPIELVTGNGFSVHRIEPSCSQDEDAFISSEYLRQESCQWVIVDHYSLDYRWQQRIRRKVQRIAVIDDLANRNHDCDLLIDQNLFPDTECRYQQLVPEHCLKLLGPQYALLRPEFRKLREDTKHEFNDLKRVLIGFGGGDDHGEIVKALNGIELLGITLEQTDVVVGDSHPNPATIKAKCQNTVNCRFHHPAKSIAALMVRSDLAIGAGGSMIWERCCLGLPALVTITADNQVEVTQMVADFGAIINMGRGENLQAEDYQQAMMNLTPAAIKRMSERAAGLVDGLGAQRAAAEILEMAGR